MDIFNPLPKPLVGVLSDSFDGCLSDQLLVNDIQIDSRKVSPGALFVALKGCQDDGVKYIANAVENGASAVLVDAAQRDNVINLEIPIVAVENLRGHLGEIAKNFFGCAKTESVRLVGVTGTNGKSSTVSLFAQLSQLNGCQSATVGTLGYGLLNKPFCHTGMTTPDVVACHRILAELAGENAHDVAMEVSSHGIHQGRIDGLRFAVGVLTNITHDHLDYHGSFEKYADVKKSFLLSEQVTHAVVNLDDLTCAEVLADLERQDKTYLTYGIENKKADVFAEVLEYCASGMQVKITTPEGEGDVFLPLVGDFNLSNTLAALAAHLALGEKFESLSASLSSLCALEGRMQEVFVEGVGGGLPRVYIDYAHTPDALAQALRALKKHASQKVWVVFGCGGDRDRAKRSVMGEIAAALADEVVLTSDNPRSESPLEILKNIASGIAQGVTYESIEDREAAIKYAVSNADINDLVLVAGKGHEDYQIIGKQVRSFSDYLVTKKALEMRAEKAQVAK